MRAASVRRGATAALAVLGVAGALLLFAQEQRTGETPTAPPLDLGEASPAQLDTVAFRGRRIEASINGRVAEVGPDGRVWLGSDTQAFPVALPDSADPRVEDRLLVQGRLRGRGGRRWLEARTWTHVRSMEQ